VLQFILEGIPPILTGPLLYFAYPAFPEQAKWLSDDEKKLVAARLQGTNSSKSTDRAGWKEIKETFKEKNLYLHYFLQFFMSLPFSSLSFFVPSIVQGFGYKGIDSNLFTVPPWAFAWCCCLLAAFIGDRYDRRGVVIIFSALIGTIAFAVEGSLPGNQFKTRYGFLFIATGATFASFPLQSGWISSNARTTAISAFAIPLNLSIGAIGQIGGLFIYKADEEPLYPTGHYTNMASCALGALAAMSLILLYTRRNRKIRQNNPDEILWST
jgi:MFS family permease